MRIGFLIAASCLGMACGSDDSSAASDGGAGSAGSGGGGGSAGSGGSAGGAGSAGSGGAAGAAGTPAEPGIRFVGRALQSGAETTFAWSGTAIGFRFDGSEASIRLDDAAELFTLLVDGQEQPLLSTSAGEQTYTLATGLSPGAHEVWLYRRTEALFGNTRFLGLELAGGTLLAPPPAKSRRIEIIGDSITCGYGNEGADQYCNFSADSENHYLTYGAIAARNLNAELSTVAWSGKGVIFNYGDDKTDPMPSLYARTLPGDASSVWGFSWQPDVVVINLGTNDFSTDGDPTQAEFSGAYQAFLADIRAKNPNARILCLIPTLLGGTDLDAAQAYIGEAVAARQAAGDSKVKAVALSFQQSGWGCDWHPSLATHAAMGAALTDELKSLLGW